MTLEGNLESPLSLEQATRILPLELGVRLSPGLLEPRYLFLKCFLFGPRSFREPEGGLCVLEPCPGEKVGGGGRKVNTNHVLLIHSNCSGDKSARFQCEQLEITNCTGILTAFLPCTYCETRSLH